MGLKEFLKPDWKKILLFLILIVSIFLSSAFEFTPILLILTLPCTFEQAILYRRIYKTHSLCISCVNDVCGLSFGGLIISSFYLYLLIVWIYEVRRK